MERRSGADATGNMNGLRAKNYLSGTVKNFANEASPSALGLRFPAHQEADGDSIDT